MERMPKHTTYAIISSISVKMNILLPKKEQLTRKFRGKIFKNVTTKIELRYDYCCGKWQHGYGAKI